MADITMCKGNGCPIREQCFRFTAKVNPYGQSYFGSPPFVDDNCDYFWSNKIESNFNKHKSNDNHNQKKN